MRSWLHDVRYAALTLRRSPRFALSTVAVLALAIGATVTVLSFASAVWLAPLPYEAPDRLLALWERRGAGASYRSQFSVHDFYFLKDASASLVQVEAIGTPLEANLLMPGAPVQIRAANTTSGFLQAFGVAPALGTLPTDDDTATGTVVLSDGLFERAFGRDPGVIGRTISIDGQPNVVAAVMPEDFQVLQSAIDGGKFATGVRAETDVWSASVRPPGMTMRGHMLTLPALRVIGRLNPGVSLDAARAGLAAAAAALVRQAPEHEVLHTRFEALPMHEEVFGDVRPLVAALLTVVGLVLLGACTSVANLMLTRFRQRARDLALLSAIGAGRHVLVRIVMTEAALLAVAGGLAGLAIAFWSADALTTIARDLPRVDEVAIDGRSVLWTVGLMMLTLLAVSVLPAIHALRVSPARVMRPTGQIGGGSRWSSRDLLILGQLALSLVLLAGAARVSAALWTYQQTDLGYDASAVSVFKLALSADQYQAGPARIQFIRHVSAALEQRGAARAAGVWPAPFSGDGLLARYGASEDALAATSERPAIYHAVTPGFFDVLGIPLLAGRDFGPADYQDRQRLVVLSASVARATFGDEPAVGRPVWLDVDGIYRPVATVVGVVPDIVDGSLRDGRRPAIYMPYGAITAQRILWMATRTGRPDPLTAAQTSDAVREINPTITVSGMQRLSDFPDAELRPIGLVAGATAGFAWLAIVMAAAGLYGLIATQVADRVREIGLRLTLGATRAQIVRLVGGRVGVLVLAGLGAGVIGAIWFGRLLQQLIVGVAAVDAVTLLTVAAVLAVVAVGAVWGPIRRAMRIEPSVAMRAD